MISCLHEKLICTGSGEGMEEQDFVARENVYDLMIEYEQYA